MAVEFDIQVRNATVKITVGGQENSAAQAGGGSPGAASTETAGGSPGAASTETAGGSPGAASTETAGGSPGAASTETAGGGPGSSSGGSPIVIGPLVVGGSGTGGNATVIGPIVINGGGSTSQPTTSASTTLPKPKAITLNPPKQLKAKTSGGTPVPFKFQKQKYSNWCWAAVAVSINDFLDPQTPPKWKQCTLATQLLENENPGRAVPTDCTEAPMPNRCNRPAALDAVLAITGNLSPLGPLFNQYLAFASIVDWVNAQLPIGARIVWNGGGAHFVCLFGYRTIGTQQMVHVHDPLYHSGLHLYEVVVEDYQQQVGGGRWQDTYPVQA